MSEEEKINFFKLYKDRVKELGKLKKLGKYIYYSELNNYDNFKDLMSELEFKEIIRLKRNRGARRSRANKKLDLIREAYWCGYKPIIVFGTLTFNNEQFKKKNGKEIKEETRTKKIDKWLKENTLYSIVNIDYGEKNEREHHHFVGILPSDTILSDTGKTSKGKKLYTIENSNYNLGYHTIELIEYNVEDMKMKKLSNYLLKINNHINKKTTKNRRFRVINNLEK